MTNKVPVVTVPTAPFIPKGANKSIETTRLWPIDALNLKNLHIELQKGAVFTKDINGGEWSVISVYSPYSDDFHVMLMETSENRYLPSIEYISDGEGDTLMKIWIETVKYMKKRKTDQQLFIGYNWSPRSWGKWEEGNGFQSIPTKWHAMFWSWPDFLNKKVIQNENSLQSEYIKYDFINMEDTLDSFKKLNGETICANDIVKGFRGKIDTIKNNTINSGKSKVKKGAYIIEFNHAMEALFATEKFFSDFLKPIATCLNDYFSELTDLFLKSPSWCKRVDKVLKKIETGDFSPVDYKFLQTLPELNTEADIRASLKAKGFSKKSQDELLLLVKNRYILENLPKVQEIKSLHNHKLFKSAKNILHILNTMNNDYVNSSLRKGFAYALTFKESGKKTVMKITPGVYLGPGGVVESERVVLNRTTYSLPDNVLLVKGAELCEFGQYLSENIM